MDWTLDLPRANRLISFIETLRVPDGALVGQHIRLRPWQREIITEVYAPTWPDGRRVVRQAVMSIGKKNAKSALVSCLILAHLCGPEAVRMGQLYSMAFDREQAALVYKYAAAMVLMDEELSDRLNIIDSRKKIVDPISGSEFSALSGEKKGKHGKSASFIAFDELADFGTDGALYDALMTARGAHVDSMAWVFSTQSPDDHAVLSQLIDYGLKVREDGSDPSFKLFLWTTPEDLDPWEEANWAMANPAMGDFKSLESMRDEAKKAQNMPSREASWRNLHLNQRIDASAHFITPDLWKGCGGAPDPETFAGREWWGGLDLSGKNDLTALVLVSQAEDGIWDVLSFFWAPGDNLRQKEDRDRAPYTVWRDKGFLIAKPGRVIDYGWVATKIGELREEYNIVGIKFDRWRINDLRREMDNLGIETWVYGTDWDEETPGAKPEGLCLVPHGQGFKDFTPAVENLEDLLMEKRLRHGMHPVLTWCISNTRIQSDPSGGRKFDKLKSTGRIDGCVALAMALNGATSKAEDAVSIYESRVVLSI
jgi:phage terminase large subunit-like protein